MVVANKITGQGKYFLGSQDSDTWEDMKELLTNYYDVKETRYIYIKEQRNKTAQQYNKSVASYSRRFVDFHRKVIKAAGQKADPKRAKYAQEQEEDERIR